jgi:hypothetical protein
VPGTNPDHDTDLDVFPVPDTVRGLVPPGGTGANPMSNDHANVSATPATVLNTVNDPWAAVLDIEQATASPASTGNVAPNVSVPPPGWATTQVNAPWVNPGTGTSDTV